MKTRMCSGIRCCWILALGLSLTGWATYGLFGESTADEQGVLYEPLFPLIPISSFLAVVAIVLALVDLIAGCWKRLSRMRGRRHASPALPAQNGGRQEDQESRVIKGKEDNEP